MVKGVRILKTLPGDVHVDAMLTNFAAAYMQEAPVFVATTIFPPVSVTKQSDKYYTWPKSTFLSALGKIRAPGTESAGGNIVPSSDSYAAQIYAFHYDLDDPTRDNADSQLQLEDSGQQYVMGALLREKERQFMAEFFTTGVWGTDVVGKAATPGAGEFLQWDQATGTDPQADVEAGCTKVLSQTGHRPNVLALGYDVFAALRTNHAVREQFKYTSNSSIDLAMLARYFNVDRVIVASSVATTDGSTYAFQGGKNALLCYVNGAPTINSVSAGYSFVWTGYTGAIEGVRIKKFRMEPIESDRIEGTFAWDQKVVGADLGYFLSACIA